MIRQAHTYLVGALSGTVLIGAAIAVFVVLVSAQVFKQWPGVSFGSNGPDTTQVSDAKSVSHTPPSESPAGAAAKAKAPIAVAPGHKVASQAENSGARGAGTATSTHVAAAAPDTNVVAESPGSSGGEAPSGSPGSGGGGSSGGSPPHAASPAPSSPAPSAGSGGSGGSGRGGETSTPTSGGGGKETSPPPSSASKALTETVNKTVTGVDETVTGGALAETGVTHVTEEVVNSVAGPESVVGHTVDEVGKVVGGLLGGGK
jgi:hypothetical protein